MKKYFSNTLKLMRFRLKKEKISIIIWLAALVFIVAATAAAYSNMFSSQEDMLAMASFFENPAMIAMMGKLYGTDITVASLYSASMLVFLAITVAIMNIFFISRNTRADEERGRIEVIRSLPTGRLSDLSSSIISAALVNLALAVFCSLALIFCLDGGSISGSLLFGLSLGAIGMLFGLIAAVFCQLFSSSRSAVGASIALLGFFYLLRAIGDVENEIIAIFSPLGIIMRTKCYVNNSWLPAIITLLLNAAITTLALYLNSIRDLERGIFTKKRTKTRHSRLKTHTSLAFKLLKNSMLAWSLGLILIALSYGSILGDLEQFIAGSGFLSDMLKPPKGHTQTEMFLTMVISMLAIAAAVPSSGAILRLAAEEKQHRYENILSKAISKQKVLSDYLIIGLINSFLMLFCAMISLWLAAQMVMENAITFSAMLASFMVYLPATWIIIGFSAILTAATPQKAGVALNSYLGYSFAIIYLGEILSFPKWLGYTTPYGFIPKLPMQAINYLTLSLLSIFALALIALSYFIFCHRDRI